MVRGCLIFAFLVRGLVAQQTGGGCDFASAVQLHQSGDLEGAIAGYRKCLAAEPGRVDARSNLGVVLAKLGRYREAVVEYEEALKSAPPEVAPRLRFNLALAFYKSFQISEAAAVLETLRAAQPDDLNLALLLADCRLQLGEFPSAVAILAPLEPAHQDEQALNYVLGMALIRSGKVSEGQIRVDRILRRGDSAEGHFLLGSALFEAGNYPAALSELTEAAARNGELASLQSYLGRAFLFTGDADSAEEAFRKELAVNPNDYDSNFQLASILARRGQTEESRKLLARAVEVRPGSAEARRALDEGFRFDDVARDGGVPVGAAAPAIGGLRFANLARPVVLVFGSYTCPKLRQASAELKRIAAAYHDRVDFRLVYISEAHAGGGAESQWQSTINKKEGIDLIAPADLAGKREHGELCLRKLSLPFALEVDGMDAVAEKAYQAWPSRLYVVDRAGKVAYQTRLGELDFHAADLERALGGVVAGKGGRGR
jgi:tetratricopeptide (TPR) repeat protein